MKKLLLLIILLLIPALSHAQSLTVTDAAGSGGGGGGDATQAGSNDFTGANSFIDNLFTIKDGADTTRFIEFSVNASQTTGTGIALIVPSVSTTLAGIGGNNIWSGTNSFTDSVFFISDQGDPTKQAQFQVSGISAGTVRTFTIPDFDGTLSTLAGVESFTNKTLVSFELGSAAIDTTFTRSAAGIAAIEGVDLVNLSATQSLTNKTLPSFELGSAVTDTTVTRSAAGIAAVEGIDLVNVSTAQSITNKTIPSFELGVAAIDTTVTRASAGIVAVEGVNLVNLSATQILSNKTFGVGSGTGVITPSGMLCKGSTVTTVSTIEEIIATCTIPANTLTTDGDTIEVWFKVTTAANANSKRIRIRFGGLTGALVFEPAALTSNNFVWSTSHWSGGGPVSRFVRMSSTTAVVSGGMHSRAKGATITADAALTAYSDDEITGLDFTIANDLVLTAATPTAIGDIVAGMWTVVLKK